MKKQFLKSLTDYVIEMDRSDFEDHTDFLYYQVECAGKIFEISKFLKQQPILGNFVPCDLDGNALDEPMFDPSNEQYWSSAFHEYEQAKERVLFKGIESAFYSNKYLHVVMKDGSKFTISENQNLEYLVYLDLELTETAVKRLGYE